jgi:hypothetical protein
MAATRKSAKRAAKKKRAGAKRGSAKKRPVRKAASRRAGKTRRTGARRTAKLKGKAKKGLKVAREGLDTVKEAGEKTWDILKSTTSQVVEGVRGKLGQNPDTGGTYR